MRKLLSLLVAVMFAGVSFSAVAASKDEKDAKPKAEVKKADKPAAAKKEEAPKK